MRVKLSNNMVTSSTQYLKLLGEVLGYDLYYSLTYYTKNNPNTIVLYLYFL